MELHIENLESLIKERKKKQAKSIIKALDLRFKVDSRNATLLHYSSGKGNTIITKLLINSGSNINARCDNGWTPLMYALEEKKAKVAVILLQADVDVLIQDIKGLSALDMFINLYSPFTRIFQSVRDNIRRRYASSEEAAKRLISIGFQLDRVLFLKDAKITEYMLENGFENRLSETIDPSIIRGGQTLLHLAVALDDLENLKLLLKFGADPHAKNDDGRIPIANVYRYSKRGPSQFEILKILLHTGIPQSEYVNFLWPTFRWGAAETVRLLLSSQVDFEKQKSDGKTALHYLALNNKPGITEELEIYRHKFDVNALDEKSVSPLHYAACFSNFHMLKFLLKHGAKINLHQDFTLPPLFDVYRNYKSKKPSDLCIELLLQSDADPQIVVNCYDESFTIFDMPIVDSIAIKNNKFKPVIAHLALLEKCGTPITKLTQSKINSLRLEKYFTRCRQMLDNKIAGNLTVFQLLTTDVKRMAKYLKKRKLVMKLTHIYHKRKLKSVYSYYFNTLSKQYSEGILYKTLKEKATVVICQLLQHRVDESSLIVEKIIYYLDEKTLRQLYLM